jgi:hypothetical protein
VPDSWSVVKRRPRALVERVIATADQAGSVMVPVCPVSLVAFAAAKLVVPKFASGRARQKPLAPHADGASTIHSAELTSTRATSSRLVNEVPRVRSAMKSFTERPETATLADMVSPGRTVRLSLTGAAGTISYQAE